MTVTQLTLSLPMQSSGHFNSSLAQMRAPRAFLPAGKCTSSRRQAVALRQPFPGRRRASAVVASAAVTQTAADSAAADAEAVDILRQAAGTRTVAGDAVFSALRRLEVRATQLQSSAAKQRGEPEAEGAAGAAGNVTGGGSSSSGTADGFPGSAEKWKAALGGTQSPGKTWRLVFTASDKELRKALKGEQGTGSYFPLVAIQRFDAAAMEIENGVFFGPLGFLTFRGPFGFSGRRLSFTFHTLSLKLGPLPPVEFNIGKEEDRGRVPGQGKAGAKDPFFTWFYADEGIAAARGRGGGSAFWTRYEGQYKK